MAHFAELNESKIVVRVIVVNNSVLDNNGVEDEQLGVVFCQNLFGGNWKQTSYNSSFRKNFAGTGYLYDDVRDAFIPPKPNFDSWVLDEEVCTWKAPIPYPQDGERYEWDELSLSWIPSPLIYG